MTRSSTASKAGRIAFGVGMVVILALLALLPARADVRIVSSPGGAVDAYLAAFARVRQSGERVIIDGPCLSACTLVLSTIPRNRICVTRRAVLGFRARDGSTLAPVIRRARPRPPVPSPPPIHQGFVPGSKSGAG